jgi:hypothetical protein
MALALTKQNNNGYSLINQVAAIEEARPGLFIAAVTGIIFQRGQKHYKSFYLLATNAFSSEAPAYISRPLN